MTTYTKERRQFAQGVKAALDRVKERHETPLVLHHSFDPRRLPEFLDKIGLYMPTGASLTQAVTPQISPLTEQWEQEKRVLEARLELMKNQLAATKPTPAPAPAEPVRWVTLAEAAKEHGVCYSTMHRAHVAGRLVTRIIGGTKKDQKMCDPSTYIPATSTKDS